MATIDNLTLEINADATKAITALGNLATALQGIKNNMPSQAKWDSASKGIRSITRALSNLPSSSTRAIQNLSNALTGLNQVRPANIGKVATNLSALQGAISLITDDDVEQIRAFGSALSLLGDSYKKLGGAGNVRKAISQSTQSNTPKSTTSSTTGGETGNSVKQVKKTINLFNSLRQASSATKSELGSIAGIVGGTLGKAFQKVIAPIKNFIKSIGRIAFYRAIRSALKSITQGLQTGIQNLALYSKAMEELDAHSANNVMSRYASEFLYFKNAVATAVIPVLRALVPIVETAINRIIDFVNVLAQLGSAFFGTNYTKAKYFWVDYADSLDNATGKAKALHHQLAQFDELNNLTAPSGGSGSDKLADASKMFEEAVIDEKIQNFIGRIKNGLSEIKAILSPTLERLKEIWNGIKEKVAPNIKRIWENLKRVWAVVKPLVVEFAKGFLEGFFGQEFDSLPDALGKLSEKIADVSDNVADWFEKLDLEKLKDWANKIGKVTGTITFLLTPLGILLSYLDIQNSRLFQWSVQLGFVMGHNITKFVFDMKDAIEKATTKIKDIYDKTVNLNDSSSVLSTNLKDLKDKFNDVKDKAKEFTDKLFTLINDIVDVKKKCEALRTYYKDHNLFENVIATGAMFLYTITEIKKVIDTLKTIGKVVISFSIQLANGNVLDNLIGKLRDIGNEISNVTKDALEAGKDNPNTQAQLPTSTPKENPNQKPAPTKKTPSITGHSISRRATGGFVPRGDLFYANEMGAEMIGSIGGNTAVANNNQITEAIATATYNAMARALSENGQNVNIVVEGDGDKMFKVFQKKQRDWQRTTGLAY